MLEFPQTEGVGIFDQKLPSHSYYIEYNKYSKARIVLKLTNKLTSIPKILWGKLDIHFRADVTKCSKVLRLHTADGK